MNATAEQLSFLQRATPLLERAKQRAAELHRPVLAALTLPLPASLPALSLPVDADAWLWEQPSHRFSISALGVAARFVAEGPGRFDSVRNQLADLLTGAILESEAALPTPPLALAGFAFDANRPHDDLWRDFPAASVTIPRLLTARREDSASLTLSTLVDASTDLEAVVSNLRDSLTAALSPAPSLATDATPVTIEEPPGDRARWAANVRDLTARIAAGEADKVVLARRLGVSAARPFDLAAAIQRMRGRYPDCTLFAVRNAGAVFLGATPERLVALDGRGVRADCMAGTARRGATPDQDEAIGAALLADDKERREHTLVTRGLSESLAAVCSDVRFADTPVLRRTANVQHLHTPIEATTDGDRHVLELVERLHPTPATAGLPAQRSQCLIRDHEPFSRGWYAGPIGWLDSEGNGEFAVALRSALVRGADASLYAGCGIVPGSDPDREYEESRIKLEAMLWSLGAKS